MKCEFRRSKPLRNGFTLLELMIALALALVIAAGVMVMLTQANTASSMVGRRGEMQMNVRAALNSMSKDIELAGTGLKQVVSVTVPNTGGATGQRLWCYFQSPSPYPCYQGSGSASAGVMINTLDGNSSSGTTSKLFILNPMPGVGPADMSGVATDAIAFMYVDASLNLGSYTISALPNTGASVTFNTTSNLCLDNAATGLANGDVLLFTGPNGNQAMAVVTGLASVGSGCDPTGSGSGGGAGANQALLANGDPFNLNITGSSSPAAGSLAGLMSQAGNSGAAASSYSAVRLALVSYFVQPTTGNTLQLMRQYGSRPAVPVADNISQLQITYDTYNTAGYTNAGTESGNDGGTTGSGSTAAPGEIRKVNILLGVRSTRPVSPTGAYDNFTVYTTVSPRDLDFINRYTGSVTGSGS